MSTPASRKAPLLSIRPDPDQPRSLLPADLVGLFTNGLMSPQAIMSQWQESPNQAFSAIVTLADSIAQHGQINPISVRRTQSLPGVEYLIVTGERRWWAHVLLTVQGRDIYEGDTREPADKIKISYVTKGVSIRAHQLIENVVREDLDAVEKAHGMWALRYELSGKNFGSTLPTSAQEKYLVDWSQVEESLGVSSRYRQYVTSVLRLTPDSLRLVAEHGLSESTIRPITQKLHKYPDLQMQALKQLVALKCDDAKHSLVKEVKKLVCGLVADISPAGSTPKPNLLPLDLPAKRVAVTTKPVPEPIPKPVPEPIPKPAPEPISKPIPQPVPAAPLIIAATTAPQVESTQKPLIATARTLRMRPQKTSRTKSAHHDLRLACTRLITALDQKSLTESKEELMTLRDKIDQFLKKSLANATHS